jgi:hypothetical protein
MVVFVITRRCAPSQPWFVYLSLPFCFIVIAIERRDNCDPNSHSSQHVNSHGSLIHHSKTWLQRLESDFRCQSFDANNQIPELGILMHTAKLHNLERWCKQHNRVGTQHRCATPSCWNLMPFHWNPTPSHFLWIFFISFYLDFSLNKHIGCSFTYLTM